MDTNTSLSVAELRARLKEKADKRRSEIRQQMELYEQKLSSDDSQDTRTSMDDLSKEEWDLNFRDSYLAEVEELLATLVARKTEIKEQIGKIMDEFERAARQLDTVEEITFTYSE